MIECEVEDGAKYGKRNKVVVKLKAEEDNAFSSFLIEAEDAETLGLTIVRMAKRVLNQQQEQGDHGNGD